MPTLLVSPCPQLSGPHRGPSKPVAKTQLPAIRKGSENPTKTKDMTLDAKSVRDYNALCRMLSVSVWTISFPTRGTNEGAFCDYQ